MFARGDKDFVLDMWHACENIISYTQDCSFEEFINDNKTKDAVVRNIEILGEAVKNLTKEFLSKYEFIEWSFIAKTRDKMIHFYFGVDEEIVWDISKNDIPLLKGQIEKVLQSEGWKGLI